jgi:tight adherence protein B
MAAGLLLGWVIFRSPLSGMALALVAYMVPGILLQRNISRRQIAFAKQLGDVLSLLAGGVRAGYSLLQAIEVVVREIKPPASDEFARVVKEVGLGVRLPEALRNLAARVQNADLDLAVTAIDIQYQVGGNMAIMLAAVTETIRERMRLFGEVRVITTQSRYTSYLLTALPVFIAALMFMINPRYMSRLFEPGPLLCIPIGAGVGIILGHFAIQRIIRLEV